MILLSSAKNKLIQTFSLAVKLLTLKVHRSISSIAGTRNRFTIETNMEQYLTEPVVSTANPRQRLCFVSRLLRAMSRFQGAP